ncbi:MAG: hydantoinase B/oxoprolinase family protein [Microthrixaceae bacterium]
MLGGAFDASGQLLVQAEHIPVHLGSMPAAVEAVIDALGELPPGEQAVVNDPFAGGTHLNDLTPGAVHVDTPSGRLGRRHLGRTTPTSVARRPDQLPPTPPTSPRRACGCRR